jgi:uncharacterized protein YchJ
MRLSEEKIKQAILHPRLDIRQRAVRYFSDCHSEDEGVVSLVIQAVEKYGRDEAYSLVGASADLRHTAVTISWVIKELQAPASKGYENYAFNLIRVLCNADPALLLPRKSEILETCGLSDELKDRFGQRLQLTSWDQADCWQRLEQICEKGKDLRYANEFGWEYATDILQALARFGGEVEQRVLSVISQTIENFEHNPMKWMEPLMVKLAGLLRLEAAVPAILGKLREDDDVLSGHCVEALSRVGTDAVVAAVAEDFAHAEWNFRVCAADVFGNIHSDLAVETAVGLLAHETDAQIQQGLAHAALSHCASEAIEPVRQLLLRSRRLDAELRYLRDTLVETCTIMDERFPEIDEWQAAAEKEREEHRQHMENLKDDPLAALAWAFGKFKDELKSAEQEEDEAVLPAEGLAAVDEILADSRINADPLRVGRNDSCPCGSGKKYKKCCMRKQQN